ncbi:MAG: hypothetical protein OEX97_06915, partial [Acidimicrobiia bacterium]|nr:hypothetical protein [Acidimicrobiia bacterium]
AYIQSIAANDQGIVVAMTRETYPPEPPQVLQIRGYTIEVDHRSGTYTLTDSSGTILMVGSTDDIWHWEDNGQGIYQPDTGELITTVPWEVWEQGWSSAHEGGPGGSPLPIPMEPTEPYVAPLFVVEWDGFVITLDENEGVYEIADAETGNVLYSGPIEQVWRGPSPRFVDPDTGDVVLSVSWEEWDEAESASWESYEEAYYWDGGYHTEAIVLFSPDGDQWDQTVISSSSSGASIAAMATDDKLVLNVNTYGEYGEDRSVWTSTDGVNWDVAESSDASERYLHSTVATADGMKSIGDGQGGQGIWSSRDGSTWTTDFTIGPQDDGQYVWLSALADGPLGTVAAGTREASYDYRPLTVSKDGVTAEFEGDFLVRITDDASGEELLALTWADFESGAVSDRVLYENEETSFFDAAGSLVMVITNEEAYEAFRIRDQNVESDSQQIMFIEVDGEWFEVEIDPGGTDHVSGVVVGDSEVLLGTVDWDNSYYWEEEFGGGISSVVILIGTPSE